MKKRMVMFALAVAVIGGTIAISAISNSYRSPSHWHAISTASVL
jgi:hypothetical protein